MSNELMTIIISYNGTITDLSQGNIISSKNNK